MMQFESNLESFPSSKTKSSIKVHHFNCGTLHPKGFQTLHQMKRLSSYLESKLSTFQDLIGLKESLAGSESQMPSQSGGIFSRTLVTHSCALETNEGIVLIDAGFSTEFLESTSQDFRRQNSKRQLLYHVQEGPEASMKNQLLARGLAPENVTHIILTHLDFDHASGCFDFPNAKIHVMHEEWAAACSPSTLLEKLRYGYGLKRLRSQICAHSHYVKDRWKGFASIGPIEGVPEILMIPLPGHTRGHCGVAFCVDTFAQNWKLHCGDVYIEREDLIAVIDKRAYQTRFRPQFSRLDAGSFLHQNKQTAVQSLTLLKNLSHQVDIFSTHAPEDLQRFL